jgi:hypothetical protein
VHHEDPPAAGAELEPLERVRESGRSPPSRETVRLLDAAKISRGLAENTRSVRTAASGLVAWDILDAFGGPGADRGFGGPEL